MLGSQLGAHSRCVTTPESQFVYEVYRSSLIRDGKIDVEKAIDRIRAHFRFKVWNIDLTTSDFPQPPTSYPELIEGIVRIYSNAVGRTGAGVWIDHTPANCMYAHTLAELFPEAKFVHIVRDGRAVAASLLALPWKFHNAHKVSEFWVKRVGYGLAAEAQLGPSRCVRVRYEDLVLNPEPTLRALSEFAELDFEPAMLSGGTFIPEHTANEHALVGKPADPGRINAWERKLSQRDIEIFEGDSGNMLSYLGYMPKFGDRARGQTRPERYLASLLDVFFYRRYDGFKERRKRARTLEKMREQGYLNRREPTARDLGDKGSSPAS